MQLTDTERLLRDTFRNYFTREIEPHVPAMESGALLPYPLMRPMHEALGLDALLSRTPRAGRGREDAAASDDPSGLSAETIRYARTTFTVEMARVSPSFTLSYGASLGLFAGNVDFGNGLRTSAGLGDAFLASYTNAGTARWSRRFGGAREDAVRAIALDGSAAVYAVGSFDVTVDFGFGAIAAQGEGDGFVYQFLQ